VPLWVRLLLEAVVVILAWRAWKSFRAARRAELQRFQAQSMIACAVALQALILLLRS
jgi:hypothetical protein